MNHWIVTTDPYNAAGLQLTTSGANNAASVFGTNSAGAGGQAILFPVGSLQAAHQQLQHQQQHHHQVNQQHQMQAAAAAAAAAKNARSHHHSHGGGGHSQHHSGAHQGPSTSSSHHHQPNAAAASKMKVNRPSNNKRKPPPPPPVDSDSDSDDDGLDDAQMFQLADASLASLELAASKLKSRSSNNRPRKPRPKQNGRTLPNFIPDSSSDLAFTLDQANARIKKIKISNRFETDPFDEPHLRIWLCTRPGRKGSSLSIQQRSDVVQLYETFRHKYAARWLIEQIELKYGLSSLRAYFSRFVSQCYRVTNQLTSKGGEGAEGNGGAGPSGNGAGGKPPPKRAPRPPKKKPTAGAAAGAGPGPNNNMQSGNNPISDSINNVSQYNYNFN